MENSNLFNENGLLDPSGRASLDEAGKWARFLGIIGLILLAIFVLLALFAGSMMSSLMSAESMPFAGADGIFFTIYFLVVAGISFYPTFMMFKFGSTIRAAISMGDAARFNEALLYLKRFFKFVGILTAIMIGLYILGFVFAILGGLVGSLTR